MRWFSREWATGGLSDEEFDARRRSHAEHLAEIRGRLLNGADLLVEEVNLHDAQPRIWRLEGDQVHLRVLAGDLQRGYEVIDLRYVGASVTGDPTAYERWLLAPGTEVLYDEI